jgi:hypothetical protein
MRDEQHSDAGQAFAIRVFGLGDVFSMSPGPESDDVVSSETLTLLRRSIGSAERSAMGMDPHVLRYSRDMGACLGGGPRIARVSPQ